MSDQEVNEGTADGWQRWGRQLEMGARFGAAVLQALGIDPQVTQVREFQMYVSVDEVPTIRLDCYIAIPQGDMLVKILEAVQWKEVQE